MGGLLIVVGLVALIWAAFNLMKEKRVLAAPFVSTADAAEGKGKDAKGALSAEGEVIAPETAFLSPVSKTACLHYKVEVIRNYETVNDEGKSVSKSDTVETLKAGTVFQIDDGSGPVAVDFSGGADFDTEAKSFEKDIKVGMLTPNTLEFGHMNFNLPRFKEGVTKSIKVIEKTVAPEGKMFVLGVHDDAQIRAPKWRSMIASNKGRDALLASNAKHKKYGGITGGVSLAVGALVMILSPVKPAAEEISTTPAQVEVAAPAIAPAVEEQAALPTPTVEKSKSRKAPVKSAARPAIKKKKNH